MTDIVNYYSEDDAQDGPYVGQLWAPHQGLLVVAESNPWLDPEGQAWVPAFLRGGYDYTFGILIDCVMCEGIRSRQEAMANVCFFNFLPRIVPNSLAPKEFDRELRASAPLFSKRVLAHPSKAAWLIGRSHQGYSAPIIQETLGIEPVLSIHPGSLRYKKDFDDALEGLRRDWRKVLAGIDLPRTGKQHRCKVSQ
jgi:hypothetical protein